MFALTTKIHTRSRPAHRQRFGAAVARTDRVTATVVEEGVRDCYQQVENRRIN
jgi:hypothetical protein